MAGFTKAAADEMLRQAYIQYSNLLVKYCCVHLKDVPESVDDCVQNIFLTYYNKLLPEISVTTVPEDCYTLEIEKGSEIGCFKVTATLFGDYYEGTKIDYYRILPPNMDIKTLTARSKGIAGHQVIFVMLSMAIRLNTA